MGASLFFMKQSSNLSERKYLETPAASGVNWSTPSSVDVPETVQTAMQLTYEQCLNRLGQRLNQIVTVCLSETVNSQENGETSGDLEIFQAIAQELSEVLVNATVILFQAKTVPNCEAVTGPSERLSGCFGSNSQQFPILPFESCPLNGVEFEVCQIKLQHDVNSQSPISCLLASGNLFYPKLGARLALGDLQHWQTQAPEEVWAIGDEQPPYGWLVIHTGSSSRSGVNPSIDLPSSRLIQQSIRLGVVALQQIRLIQAHCQQRQQLRDRNRDLVQTNQLKSEFLANTSHEIRTPLSSILGFTHLLQAQGFNPMNLRHQEYLNIILTSGQHLLSLINDILDLSKIEANQLDLQWETVDVRNLCQMAMTLVKEKASDKGLKTHLHIDPAVTTLVADGLRLKQMLFNLLSNAIKFTLKGEIGIEVTLAKDILRFTVWDTGTGISQEQQQLLFRPYAQLANVAIGPGEGTGLGLALTQKLAELHGGWVEVCSEPDQGSRFTIALPLVPPSLPAPPLEGTETPVFETKPASVQSHLPETSASKHLLPCEMEPRSGTVSRRDVRLTNRRKKQLHSPVGSSLSQRFSESIPSSIRTLRPNHLMLVEDNVHNAKLMLTFLSKSGYEVTWVQDGREMWQALERSLPALILMDIHLPEVDGLTLTRQLKQDERYQTIPVIAQTALAMKGDRDLCLEAGAVNYISKPINLDVLAKMVKQVLEGLENLENLEQEVER